MFKNFLKMSSIKEIKEFELSGKQHIEGRAVTVDWGLTSAPWTIHISLTFTTIAAIRKEK